jgi:hypothetical protein
VESAAINEGFLIVKSSNALKSENSLPEAVLAEFCEFITGEIKPADFERWICAEPNLDSILGKTAWLDLVSINIQDACGQAELKEKASQIVEQHNPKHLIRVRVKKLLKGMLDGTVDLVSGCGQLSTFWNQQEEWIPVAFVGYYSEFDDVPRPNQYKLWSEATLQEKLKKVDFYRKDILQICKEFLQELDGNARTN